MTSWRQITNVLAFHTISAIVRSTKMLIFNRVIDIVESIPTIIGYNNTLYFISV